MELTYQDGLKLAKRNCFKWDFVRSQKAVRESRITINNRICELSDSIRKIDTNSLVSCFFLNGTEIKNVPDTGYSNFKPKSYLLGVPVVNIDSSGELTIGTHERVSVHCTDDFGTEMKVLFIESKKEIPANIIEISEDIKNRKNQISEMRKEIEKLKEMYKAVSYDFDKVQGNLSKSDFKGICNKIAKIFNEGYDPFEYYIPSISEIVEFFLFPEKIKEEVYTKEERESDKLKEEEIIKKEIEYCKNYKLQLKKG